MKPEILLTGDVKRQLVIFARAFSDEDLSFIDFQGAKTLGARDIRVLAKISSGTRGVRRDFAGYSEPGIPIFDCLQTFRLLIEHRKPIPYVRKLFSNNRTAAAGLLMLLEHSIDVLP